MKVARRCLFGTALVLALGLLYYAFSRSALCSCASAFVEVSSLPKGTQVTAEGERRGNLFGTSNQFIWHHTWLLRSEDPKELVSYLRGRAGVFRSSGREFSWQMAEVPRKGSLFPMEPASTFVAVEVVCGRARLWYEIFD